MRHPVYLKSVQSWGQTKFIRELKTIEKSLAYCEFVNDVVTWWAFYLVVSRFTFYRRFVTGAKEIQRLNKLKQKIAKKAILSMRI